MLADLLLPWQLLAVLATMVYGVMNFLYKVAAVRGASSFYLMSFSGMTVALFAGTTVAATGSSFERPGQLFVLAAVNSLFFATGSIFKIEALRFLPANVTFPVVKLNSVIAVIIAMVVFSERPSILQYLGIGLGILVILQLSFDQTNKDGETIVNYRKGILFALGAAFSTAISMTMGKIASTHVHRLNYIFISYSLVAVYTLISTRAKKSEAARFNAATAIFGVLIGSLNFLGYYLVLLAFSRGPMSGVQPIFAMSIIIPIVLAGLLYHERFTWRRATAVALSLVSILLISLH
ncbi:MAG: DMT family transporter [Deltaproteobacteria bacterium]|nr:DMT family transporter [Deltaproteobacteria bacterium]